jgi:hypothetical protein
MSRVLMAGVAVVLLGFLLGTMPPSHPQTNGPTPGPEQVARQWASKYGPYASKRAASQAAYRRQQLGYRTEIQYEDHFWYVYAWSED